ncbi:hypothetical protein FSC37_22975 [Piscinibacter aquaticus]|uniref:Uncharacterized protein n=1 Tax=Piscinibacter aquaticus TaxID=392597 RepID=A0A5C6TQ53_9BURK|nr:hypothetical protein FSC37_22975 [Piscinibacter aquaticus]
MLGSLPVRLAAMLLVAGMSSVAWAAEDALDRALAEALRALEEDSRSFPAFDELSERLKRPPMLKAFGAFMSMPSLEFLPEMARNAARAVPGAAAQLRTKSAEAASLVPRLNRIANEAETLYKQIQARPSEGRPYLQWRAPGQLGQIESMAKRANDGDRKAESELLQIIRATQTQGLMPQVLRLATQWYALGIDVFWCGSRPTRTQSQMQ